MKWNTKRKLEKLKFDLENKLGKSLPWDDFLNEYVEVLIVDKQGGKKK